MLALGVLAVTSMAVVSAVDYSAANGRHSSYSKAAQESYALAEAGVNNALAVLSNPDNNALTQATLPPSEQSSSYQDYVTGRARWWGVFDGLGTWQVCGLGLVRNPTGPGLPQVRRQICANADVANSLAQKLNNQAWNYIFAKDTGNTCDVTIVNNVMIDASLYVNGNLCLDNSAQIVEAPGAERTLLVVRGKLSLLKSGNAVGQPASKIAEAHVVTGCSYGGAATHIPCSSADNVWADRHTTSPTQIDPPTADYAYWYEHAEPGPRHPCTEQSGPVPLFDNDGVRNASLGSFNLTPSVSYTCRVRDYAGELVGELSWDPYTRQLTVLGAIYLDGSATVSDNAVNDYRGRASLYLSGTFSIGNSAELCGGIAGGHCDFTAWNPNSELLAIVADGLDGAGNSVMLTQSARFQGAIYATGAVRLANSTEMDGPMIAGTFHLENWSGSHAFPVIEVVPRGFPGNPNVYAEPQPPGGYTG